MGKKRKNGTLSVLPENILIPHQLTLEWAEGVAVDPVSL